MLQKHLLGLGLLPAAFREHPPALRPFQLAFAESGETVLTGAIRDQSALYGILDKLRDLGVTLLSVRRVVPEVKEGERVSG
jgi:hypothetical protein